VALTLSAKRLVPLATGKYALVSLETDALGAHVDHGAIAVAYLSRRGGRWRLERRWDELAWTGNTGNAADEVALLRRPGAPPLAFAISADMHQGQGNTNGWAIALGERRPKVLGSFPIAGELEPNNGCDVQVCGAYSYRGSIERSKAAGASFTVTYRGWTLAPRGLTRQGFIRSTNYKVEGLGLRAMPAVNLPDHSL